VLGRGGGLPLVLPPTVLGYYLLVLLGRESPLGRLYEWIFGAPLVFTWQAAVVAAMVHAIPLLVISGPGRPGERDRSYERAARNLGASEWRVLLEGEPALARRSIMAVSVLAFAAHSAISAITIMIAGNIPGRTQTMAVAIYDAVESGNGALARTLVIVISVLALVILSIANRLAASRRRMIQARIRKRFAERPDASAFSLEVDFQAASGVTVLFGPAARQDPHPGRHRRLWWAPRKAASCWTTRSCSTPPRACALPPRRGIAATCSRTTPCSRT